MIPYFWSDTPKTKEEKDLGRLCLLNNRIWFRLKDRRIHVCEPDGCAGFTYSSVDQAIKEEREGFGK